uniref:F-box domain-containing protein n=1 Tax=Leersia perrieri TaxID=77586 RepID=A0A0D9WMC3_9ORYZ
MKHQAGSGGGYYEPPVAKRRRCIGGIIPEEIVEQILLRLPVKSIVRFRSVCKSWQSMIADPRFTRLHLQFHQSTTSMLLR